MALNHDLAATRDCWCLAARRTARRLTRMYEKHLRPHGLRATQFSILASLSIRGATPVGGLARGLDLERTTVTRSAALLERNGWIRRAPATDAREHVVELTSAGREKLEAALPAWRAAQEAALREFGKPEVRSAAQSTGIRPMIEARREAMLQGKGGGR